MRQGSFGWLVGSVLVVLPAAAWGQGGADALEQAGIRGSAGTCDVLFFERKFAAGDGPRSVATGDLDGDGDLDLVVANNRSDDVSVLLNICDQRRCLADLDGSGDVGVGDLLAILLAWGSAGGPEDLDGSGIVDIGDLLVVLAAWGPCP